MGSSTPLVLASGRFSAVMKQLVLCRGLPFRASSHCRPRRLQYMLRRVGVRRLLVRNEQPRAAPCCPGYACSGNQEFCFTTRPAHSSGDAPLALHFVVHVQDTLLRRLRRHLAVVATDTDSMPEHLRPDTVRIGWSVSAHWKARNGDEDK